MPVLLALGALLAVQDKADLSKTKLFVYDSEKGITLRVKDDGKVELTVKEEKEDKSYSAGSAEEFERKYPDVVRKNGLGKYLRSETAQAPAEFEKWWADLKRGKKFVPELPDLDNPLDQDWDKWFDEQRKFMDGVQKFFRTPKAEEDPPPDRPAPKPAEPGRGAKEFGIKIDAVGETLRDQLGLKEGEGVQVGEIKPGSIAEKAGLKQHDIILKLDGRDVGDKWEFRKDVLKALDKPEFDVQILRAGKKETLKAKTGSRKED